VCDIAQRIQFSQYMIFDDILSWTLPRKYMYVLYVPALESKDLTNTVIADNLETV